MTKTTITFAVLVLVDDICSSKDNCESIITQILFPQKRGPSTTNIIIGVDMHVPPGTNMTFLDGSHFAKPIF